MMSSNALSRTRTVTQDNQRKVKTPLGAIVANKIALAWTDTVTAEDALGVMSPTMVQFRAVPPAQNAFASICADLMTDQTRVSCCGVQSYGWMISGGMTMANVMRVHLGKILATNIVSMSAEDIAANMKKGPMQIVALHVEDAQGWTDVRQVSAAAVKAETPMLMLISASVPAPEGVALDIVKNWDDAAHDVREAFVSVRDLGAIRLVAMEDMPANQIEQSIMAAAEMTGQAWADAIQKNADSAEAAMNIAYTSAVETF